MDEFEVLSGRHRSSQLRLAALSLVVLLWGLSAAVADAGYPTPPPSFPQVPAGGFNPGFPLFSPWGGQLDRPVLVIYVHFADAPEQADKDEAWLRQRFFVGGSLGGFPNVRDFYLENSFGALELTPAPESQGMAGDGIVSVTFSGDIADWLDPNFGGDPKTAYEARNRRALELADPWVDYASFDTDGNGRVTDAELMVVSIRVARTGLFEGINGPPCPLAGPTCGPDIAEVANRPAKSGSNLDGKGFTGLNLAMLSTESNFSTTVHEMAHSLVGMIDLYGPRGDMDGFDISGATIGTPFDQVYHFGPWNKMHWGWIKPTVVTKDGYYDVHRADVTGSAYLLYDPDKGQQDFLLVENRQRTPGLYDQDVADEGIVVYRVGEQNFINGSASLPFPSIRLLRPSPQASAFDPSDPLTPIRNVLAPSWRDGSTARVKIRAIGDSGPVVRVFFDVPGPGVLVDPYDLQGTILEPGTWNTIKLPVTNTGDTAGSFVAAIVAPVGWIATNSSPALIGPGATALVSVKVKPYLQSKMGTYKLDATAYDFSDSSIQSTAPLNVVINKPPVVLKQCNSGPCTNVQIVTPGGIAAAIPLPVPVDRFRVRPKPYGPTPFQITEPLPGRDALIDGP